MLNRGFSLFEMLLNLAMTSLVILSIMAFYPKFHLAILRVYQQNRLEEVTHQALSGMIKDIRRAGFIANFPDVTNNSAIEINTAGDCIIVRYDTISSGKWRYFPYDPQRSDVFAYRYSQNNLDSQSGVTDCRATSTRWERLFDPSEITVTQFHARQFAYYVELKIMVQLKRNPAVSYQTIYYVKNHNR